MNKEELIIKLFNEKMNGINFKTIAQDIGISGDSLSKFIKRRQYPDKKICQKLTEYFNRKEGK